MAKTYARMAAEERLERFKRLMDYLDSHSGETLKAQHICNYMSFKYGYREKESIEALRIVSSIRNFKLITDESGVIEVLIPAQQGHSKRGGVTEEEVR